MSLRSFRVSASVLHADPADMAPAIEEVFGTKARIVRRADGFELEVAAVVGVEARELNRRLLSGMRAIDPSVRMRATWTAEGATDTFRDYVLMKDRPGTPRG